MIIATARKAKGTDYYKSSLIVKDSDYLKIYNSCDMFLDKKTAQKHADLWKNESLEIGQIIDF